MFWKRPSVIFERVERNDRSSKGEVRCVYCNMGDTWFRYDAPFTISKTVPNYHLIPQPLVPVNPWSIEKLKEYLNLLKQVYDMEQKLGCPCEPNKADYIKLFQDRIDTLKGLP